MLTSTTCGIPHWGLFCHVDIGVFMGAVLDDESFGRTALSCHSALDILCSKDVCALNDVTVCAISVTV